MLLFSYFKSKCPEYFCWKHFWDTVEFQSALQLFHFGHDKVLISSRTDSDTLRFLFDLWSEKPNFFSFVLGAFTS